MRALVTGGAGFIGSNLVDALLDRGDEVTVVDDLSTGKAENLEGARRRGIEFHRLDIRDAEALTGVLEAHRPDIVFHLAAQIDVRRSVADPVFDATTNVLGIVNLLEAVKASGFDTRVVFTSTGGAIYGDFNTPPNVETHPKDPDSPYAIGKLASEYYLAYYGRLHGLEHASLRFGNVYGPRQDPHGEAGVVAIFCNRILAGKPLTIYGDGMQTRDYVYVGDVANAIWRGATCDLPPAGPVDTRSFNIGTGIGTSVVDVARLLQQAAGSSVDVVFAPRRPGELQESFLKVDKARDVLGWQPQVSLADGLARTFAWAEEENAVRES